MHHIGVVAGHSPRVPLAVADHHSICRWVQTVLSAQVRRQLHCRLIHLAKVVGVLQAVFAEFKGDMRIIGAAPAPPAAVPPPHIPGQSLHHPYTAVSQFAEKGMDTGPAA